MSATPEQIKAIVHDLKMMIKPLVQLQSGKFTRVVNDAINLLDEYNIQINRKSELIKAATETLNDLKRIRKTGYLNDSEQHRCDNGVIQNAELICEKYIETLSEA